MEDVLARFLDGELDERDADRLILAAAEDPRIGAALREYETILNEAADLPRMQPPGGFADRVLDRVRDLPPAARNRTPRRVRPAWLSAAAGLLLGLALGYFGAPGDPSTTNDAAVTAVVPAVSMHVPPPAGAPGVQTLPAVRLTYVSNDADVESVSVAGSFNGWDPSATPMQRDGEVWTILLVLPPGLHEYMFIENERRWVTDPAAPRTRDDGFGGSNGLLEVRS